MKPMFKKSIFILAIGLFIPNSWAQTMPSAADLKAKQLEIQNSMKSFGYGSEINTEQGVSNKAATKATDSLTGATLNGRQATPADFTNLARPGSQTQSAQPKRPSSDLMIFVSMSMPEESLRQYANQAKRFGAVLMMRGFVNDKMSDTRETLAKLNPSAAEWEINPEPFNTFKIDKVPAIVLATAESASVTEDGCAKPETYTVVFGDITVADALDKIALHGQKTTAAIAKERLRADKTTK
jgi:type-F conjugative transfer system pilin assembly protein TrbC